MLDILQNYSLNEIEQICASLGEPKFRAKQIYEGIYAGKNISDISNISKEL